MMPDHTIFPSIWRISPTTYSARWTWMMALNRVERGFSIIRRIVLSTLLLPADLDLFGIAILISLTLENVSKLGIETALIQRLVRISCTYYSMGH